jgi:Ca-activated chloride channel family protein
MSFDEPRHLFLLCLLAPAIFIAPRRFGRRLAGLLALVGSPAEGGVAALTKDLRNRYFFSTVFFLSSMAFAVIALAGPRWGERFVSEYRRGVDVVLALDLSRSMDARDIGPSRLARAAAVGRELVESSPGIRFAVAIGKGGGELAVPLTDDTESVLALLDAASSSAMSSGGTDLERLVDAARTAFLESVPTRRVIVLLSDGEALSGTLSAAAERASLADISIIAVGLGTVDGSPVPVSAAGTMLTLPDGSPVMSSLRDEPLRSAAERSGGIYVDGNRNDAGRILVERISAVSSHAAADGFRRESMPRSHLFLIAALLAFGAAKLAENGFRRKR